jgi:hypothetical protein
MTKTSVADVLRELAKGDKARSETARLRDVMDEVEAALAAGVSRAAVLEALHGQGFTMTLKSFESALYRIRKQREAGEGKNLSHDEGSPAGKAEKFRHDEKTANPAPVAPAEGKKTGEFEIPVPKRFTHNPNPDDDLLK